MLSEVDKKTYRTCFSTNPHPFISDGFIELNSHKTGKIVRLIGGGEKPSVGLVAGIKDGALKSPFSAPFGGMHFRNEIIYITEIDSFFLSLKEYISQNRIERIEITLPPDLYHQSFNAKTVNSLIRNGFSMAIPEITNWVNIESFRGEFSQKNSREYYRQAVRNGLIFSETVDETDKREIYQLICQNRARFGRPIYMSLEDIIGTSALWPVDFFRVNDRNGAIVSSAIFYRFNNEIAYAVYWGDNDAGRPLRAMDFLVLKLIVYYKERGFNHIDLGISTETGLPNEGLLRFKESHDAISSPKYKFSWSPDMK